MLKNEIVQLKSYNDKTGQGIGNVLPITNSEAVKVEDDKNLKEKLTEINKQIEHTNALLDNIVSYSTPLMFGAIESIGENYVDCYAQLQECYDNSRVIDLMGKKWYITEPIKLKSNKLIKNGTIISLNNTFVNSILWCRRNDFVNLNIESLNGYCFYIENIDGKIHNGEFYDSYFKNLRLTSKLGGYYAHNCQIGFSLAFEDIWVKTENGHGFTGVKSPGSRMTHIVNEGHPNGALFSNCFCPIEVVDSNQLAKYGLYYENYFNADVVSLKNCNFEHIMNQGIVLKTGGLKINMDNVHFTKTRQLDKRVNTEGFYFNGGSELTLRNIGFSNFNYSDEYVDIKMSGSPFVDIDMSELKIKNTDYYTNQIFTISNVKGKLTVNSMGTNNSKPYENYNNARIIYDTRIQNMYYPTDKKSVTINNQTNKLLQINDVLGNNFNIIDKTVTKIHGINPPSNFELGNCTLISISNNTGTDLTLTHNHWEGRRFYFKDGQNKVLPNTKSVIFIVKDNHLYELY